jgi:hypothetical protein
MSMPSKKLRQAVFQALTSARIAAAAHRLASELGALTSDENIKNELKEISEAAYAASAHAWMAMIALTSRNLKIARSAAQSACNAKQHISTISRHAFAMDPSTAEDINEQNCVTPDERQLLAMWRDFCASLPHQFPVPDNFDQSLSPVVKN